MLIHSEELRELFAGDEEIVREVVQLFIEETQTLLGQLREAVAAEDTARVQSLAHKVAGSAGNIRANQLFHTAKAVETELITHPSDTACAAEGAKRIENDFALTRTALTEAFLGAQPARSL